MSLQIDLDMDWERFKLRAQIASEQLFALENSYRMDDWVIPEMIREAVKITDLLLAELEKEKE